MAAHCKSSCLENPMDREALWAPVPGVTESWTRLNRLSKPLTTRAAKESS